MRTYDAVLQELKEKGIGPWDGVFCDYSFLTYHMHYDGFFNFCQYYLDRDYPEFNIHPARIYFNTNIELNALARKYKGYSLIEIYQGALSELVVLFAERDSRFDESFVVGYGNLAMSGARTPGLLLFQIVLQYLFYHEVGHLIQYTAESDIVNLEFLNLSEELSQEEIMIRHMREMDADWFAAYNLALHIKQMSGNGNNNEEAVDIPAFNDFVALVLSGVYVYFIRQSPHDQAIYYREKTHPHPSIRLSYMLYFILENLANEVSKKIDRMEILRKTVQISEHLMIEGANNIVAAYSQAIYGQAVEIDQYIKTMIGDTQNYPHLCMHILRKKHR